MVDEFPGNSHMGRETKSPQRKQKDKPEVEQIVTSGAHTRKRPIGKRLRENFLGANAKSAWGYVAIDVLIPAAQNMLADAFRMGSEYMIFGGVRSAPRSPFRGGLGASQSGYVRYNASNSSAAPSARWGAREAETRPAGATHQRVMQTFEEIILDSRGDAERVLDTLIEIIRDYESVTLSDLYQMVGVKDSYTDQKYGWTDLRGASVRPIRGGFLLDLPKPEPLN